MYNCPTGVLPNMDDMVVLNEWTHGMPYLPMHTDVWMQEQPHPNYVDGWYLWCDLDTKATYIVQTAYEGTTGMNIHMGGNVVVTVNYADAVDTTEEGYYEEYDDYDPDYNDNIPETIDGQINPWYAQNKYKVGYMWDNNGKGYMMGNKYHQCGWWCLDDCLYNMELWDMKDEWHLRTDEEEEERVRKARETLRRVTGDQEPEEYLAQLGLQMGGVNVGNDAQYLEQCLRAD